VFKNVKRVLRQEIDLDTGAVVLETYLLNNRRHRDPAEGPAIIGRDPVTRVVTFEEYFAHGRLHRLDGPAAIIRDAATGIVVSEWYGREGQPHREDGPSYLLRDPATGIITHEVYTQYGLPHREPDAPTAIDRDAATGAITHQEFFHSDFAESVARHRQRVTARRRPRRGNDPAP
jgi:hypothetical protein